MLEFLLALADAMIFVILLIMLMSKINHKEVAAKVASVKFDLIERDVIADQQFDEIHIAINTSRDTMLNRLHDLDRKIAAIAALSDKMKRNDNRPE